MDIIEDLNHSFLNQTFDCGDGLEKPLQDALNVAHTYARIENAIAVLSDLKSDRSYIYHGAVADVLGIAPGNNQRNEVIDSIWEEEIYSKIHPDDLLARHLLELKFFHLLKTLPLMERPTYHTCSTLRMLNTRQEYIPITHRTLYLHSSENGSLWLALCLYGFCIQPNPQPGIGGFIFHSTTGKIIPESYETCNQILSGREKEILKCVGNGLASKEIAEQLHISLHTVNRHRQNILEKLRVKNSIEALKVAEAMNML